MLLGEYINNMGNGEGSDYNIVNDLKNIMPCDYTFDEKSNEITIKSVAKNMHYAGYKEVTDAVVLEFQKGRAKASMYLKNPFLDEDQKGLKATIVRLSIITKEFGAAFNPKFDVSTKDFKGLLEATVGQIEENQTADILVQFSKKYNESEAISKYVNLTVYTDKDSDGNYVNFIGKNVSDVSSIVVNKMTLLVESKEPNLVTSEVVRSVDDLDDLI